MEPSWISVIASGIGVVLLSTATLAGGIWLIAEWWRTRRGYALKNCMIKSNDTEVRFITGGRGRKS